MLHVKIARELLDDLRGGRLAKVGIDEIRSAMREHPLAPVQGTREWDKLEEATTRAFVNLTV